MDELLTARQVQELLHVDRTTIYRMLNDGRLVGVKIGQQWRFSRQEVDVLLSGTRPNDNHTDKNNGSICTQVLPIHCVQAIQDVFADVAQVGAVTTEPNGEPLTKISNSCRFCDIILASKSGRDACIASWQKLAEQSERKPKFVECHAGLQYARAPIEVDGELIAVLIAGQFYASPPEPMEEAQRIKRLADSHNLKTEALVETARELPVLDDRMQAQIGGWLVKVANVFSEVGRERAELMNRLRRIAAISILEQE